MKKGKSTQNYRDRTSVTTSMINDEDNRKNREDAEKYRIRKEIRETLALYTSIAVGAVLLLIKLMQAFGGLE